MSRLGAGPNCNNVARISIQKGVDPPRGFGLLECSRNIGISARGGTASFERQLRLVPIVEGQPVEKPNLKRLQSKT